MSVTITPNMSLQVPGVGTENGPLYAFDVNASLTLIDTHDHSSGKGVQITPAGLNINTDLSFNSHSITTLKSLTLVSQASLATPLTLYVAPGAENVPLGDLFYNDSAGNVIQITKGGIVNTTASSIPGESYVAGTFIWTQTQSAAPTTPANFDIGSITIRPNTPATSNGVTVSPPSAIASAYNIILPTDPSTIPPGDGRFLTIQNTGVINSSIPVTAGLTGSNIAAQTINGSVPGGAGTGNIADGTIGLSNIAAGVLTVQTVNNFGVGVSSFTVPAGVSYIQALLVAGGGGGGGGGGLGGGGAGGAGGGGSLPIYGTLNVSPGDVLTITVGAGGTSPGGVATDGADSTIFNTTTSTQLMFVQGGFGGNSGSGSTPGTGQNSLFNGQGFHIGGSNGGNTGGSGAAGQSTFFGTGGGGGAASGGGGGGGGGGGYIGQGGTGGSGAGGSPGVTGGNANSPGGGGGGGGGGNPSGGNGGVGGNGLCRLIYAQVV